MPLRRITTVSEAQVFAQEKAETALVERRFNPATAAHLVPFCQRYDRIKADYAPEAERIRYVQKIAREAYDKMLAAQEVCGINRKKVAARVADALPDHKPQVERWLKDADERAALPDAQEAREGLAELGIGELDRYCRKSGALIARSTDEQVQALSAVLEDDALCERYCDGVLRRNQIMLQHHGISLAWFSTGPRMLERLRSVDPAGYCVYLLASWQHGQMQADTLGQLQERIDAYRVLSERDDIMTIAGIVELLAKTSYAVRDARLTLPVVAAMPLRDIRVAAAGFITRMIRLECKTAAHDKARLSMAVFYRMQGRQNVPTAIKKVRRGKRTPEGSAVLGIWALSHSTENAFDELDFELPGAISHELTLAEIEDQLYDESDDMLDEFLDADTIDALEDIPDIAAMEVTLQKQMAANGGDGGDGLLPASMTGDVFDDLF